MSEVEATERQALLQKVRWSIHTLSSIIILPFVVCGTGAGYVLCKAPCESRLRILQGNVLNIDEV